MIRLEDVSKSYGTSQALDRVSLDLSPGTLFVVAGADGAGKTTLLKAIVGLVRIDAGRIYYRGRPIEKGFKDLRRATGYMPEKSSLYPDLTIGETLRFTAEIHRLPRPEADRTIRGLLEKTGLEPFIGRRTAALSGGMRQKLALCAALLPSPEILILDEPTAGIDPLSRLEVARMIAGLKAEGKAVLMSTSDLHEAEEADEILYLKHGRTILRDTVRRLKERSEERTPSSLEDICLFAEHGPQGGFSG
jgi:ABC-2 type transport system ATP-binding protein